MDHLIKSWSGISQSMEGADVHAHLRAEGEVRREHLNPAICRVFLSAPHGNAEEWQKRKRKNIKFIPFHRVVVKELGLSGQRADLPSKAQHFQRIIQPNYNCELIRKAEITPRIIFVPQRVCKGGLKADSKNPIGTSFRLLQHRRPLTSNITIN